MTQEINKAFHEALGKCWHTFSSEGSSYQGERICTKCGFKAMDRERNPHGLPELPDVITVFPDYCADPRLVIEVMRGRVDWEKFLAWLISGLDSISLIMELFIDLIMDTTGKLALLGIEWLRREE